MFTETPHNHNYYYYYYYYNYEAQHALKDVVVFLPAMASDGDRGRDRGVVGAGGGGGGGGGGGSRALDRGSGALTPRVGWRIGPEEQEEDDEEQEQEEGCGSSPHVRRGAEHLFLRFLFFLPPFVKR